MKASGFLMNNNVTHFVLVFYNIYRLIQDSKGQLRTYLGIPGQSKGIPGKKHYE
jgi:hypothetical protein